MVGLLGPLDFELARVGRVPLCPFGVRDAELAGL